MSTEEDDYLQLLRDIARSDALTEKSKSSHHRVPPKFIPLFKHPLPMSNHRYKHESNLRRILSCKLERQAVGAVSLGDAWVLEEAYLRGAPVDIADGNGFQPIHIACQMNNHSALMVLLNIEVDFNALSVAGFTPLFMAQASNARQKCILLLEEAGARAHIPITAIASSSLLFETDFLLEDYDENDYYNPSFISSNPRSRASELSVIHKSSNNLGVPHDHLSF